MRARSTMKAALGALAVGLLSGCVPTDGRTFPNSTDLGRAQAVWSDPWVMPDSATVAGAPAIGNLSRVVGGRTHVTPMTPRVAIATEIRAAATVGWRLIGASCSPDESGYAGDAIAQLTRGTGSDVQVATVSGKLTGSNNPPKTNTQVSVSAAVPHHLDPDWVLGPPIELESSCLVRRAVPPPAAGTPTGSPSPSTVPEPIPDDLTGERVDAPEWKDDPVTDDLRLSLQALRADPGIRALGLAVSEPTDSGDSWTRAAAASKKTPLKTTDLAQTVTSLTSQGWELTYAACIGPSAPHVAELSRPVGPRSAVLRLSHVPLAPQLALSPVDGAVVISTPGYSPEPGQPVTDPCFAEAKVPQAFAHKGTPTLGPTRMLPLLP